MRPCHCGKCHLCHLAATSYRYQALWGLDSTGRDLVTQCVYLGSPTTDTVECGSCPKGKVRLKLSECAVHGRCLPGSQSPGTASCVGCPDKSMPPLSILITGGLGDFFVVESLMTPAERQAVEHVIVACRQWKAIESLLWVFPNLKSHEVLLSKNVFYEMEGFVKEFGVKPGLTDYSILRVFPQNWRTWSRSTVLNTTMPSPVGGRYAFIAPYSLYSGMERWLTGEEWTSIIRKLEGANLQGVVVWQGSDKAPVPKHSRLTNLINQTTAEQAIALLKGAKCYIGIDTCWSVLAAQLFPANKLAIKSINPHYYRWRHLYAAPHTEFPFVAKTIRGLK